MAEFEFTAMDERGQRQTGTRPAGSVAELSEALRREGLFLVRAGRSDLIRSSRCPARIPSRTLSDFTERLEILLKAGFPLAGALHQIANDTVHPGTRAVILDLHDVVTEGRPLHEALDRHPLVFDDMYRSVVAAGEQSGTLEEVLERLSAKLIWRNQTRSQVKSAFTYPTILFTAILGLLLLILFFLIPRISVIFEKSHVDPPKSTLFLLGVKAWLAGHWMAVILGGAAGVCGFSLAMKGAGFRGVVQAVLYRLPLVGRLLELSESATFVNLLGLMNRSGVTVSNALRSIRTAVRTERMKAAVEQVLTAVTAGNPLTESVAATGAFSPLVVQMVSVGERSGALTEALGRAERYLDREVPRAVGKVVLALGPTMTIVGGAAVAFAVFSVLAPLMSVLKAVKGGG